MSPFTLLCGCRERNVSPLQGCKIEAERRVFPAGTERLNRVHGGTFVHVVRSGRVDVRWDGKRYSCEPFQLVWIPPGVKSSEYFPERTVFWTMRLRPGAWTAQAAGDRDALAIMRWLDGIYRAVGPVLPISPATGKRVLERMREMSAAWKDETLVYPNCVLKAGAMMMLADLSKDKRLIDCPQNEPESEKHAEALARVAPALDLLNKREYVVEPGRTVEMLAKTCNYRPSSFHAHFVAATGTTPLRYLTERRISIACDLLRQPHRNILDVAMECGFSTPSRFYAAFKQVTGQAPGQWRKANGDEQRTTAF